MVLHLYILKLLQFHDTKITSRNPFFKGKPPTCQLMYGRGVVCWGVPWLVHPGERGVPWLVHPKGGGPLPCSLLGGSTSMFTSGGDYFWGGSHVTYPIMLLYTTIECPSASWAKFTWDPPPPELDRLTNMSENITFPDYVAGGNKYPE